MLHTIPANNQMDENGNVPAVCGAALRCHRKLVCGNCFESTAKAGDAGRDFGAE